MSFPGGLGYAIGEAIFDPLQNVHLLMCGHPAMPSVEVIYPATGADPLDTLLARHGQGLVYHLCYTTRDLNASLEAMESVDAPRVAADRHPRPPCYSAAKQVSFYIVAGVGLIEIIEDEGTG